jgi:hypothetical protein
MSLLIVPLLYPDFGVAYEPQSRTYRFVCLQYLKCFLYMPGAVACQAKVLTSRPTSQTAQDLNLSFTNAEREVPQPVPADCGASP